MNRNGVDIEDTFAEAFSMTATRVLITAMDAALARTAATSSLVLPVSSPHAISSGGG